MFHKKCHGLKSLELQNEIPAIDNCFNIAKPLTALVSKRKGSLKVC